MGSALFRPISECRADCSNSELGSLEKNRVELLDGVLYLFDIFKSDRLDSFVVTVAHFLNCSFVEYSGDL